MPEPLDYRPPILEPWDWRRAVARWLGIGLMVFGVPFLLRGVISLLEVFKGMNRFLRSGSLEQGAICVALGAVCVIVGIGWIRHSSSKASED